MKGQPVWLEMDQAELDAAYDQASYAPNLQQVLERYATNSELTRSRLGAPRRFAYGAAAIEGLDVFFASKPNAPIHVFLHGGAWRSGAARDYAFLAEMFVNAGAHFVVPDFSWVQDSGGSLEPIAAQVRRAVAWVYQNAENFDGNPERIFVSGHSSGAHLAGVVLTTDWQKDFKLPADLVKGGLCCSGLFELQPVGLSSRSSYVKLTDQIAQALSPQRNIKHLCTPLIVACGTLETPEFQRQSRDFVASVRAAGKSVQLLVAANYNHFEIIETLANPYGLLGSAVLQQMKIG